MSDEQVTPADGAETKEAQARLRAFEVGIGRICNDLGIEYAEFAKRANATCKFAETDEEASGKLAPWLVDVIVEQATKEEQAKA